MNGWLIFVLTTLSSIFLGPQTASPPYALFTAVPHSRSPVFLVLPQSCTSTNHSVSRAGGTDVISRQCPTRSVDCYLIALNLAVSRCWATGYLRNIDVGCDQRQGDLPSARFRAIRTLFAFGELCTKTHRPSQVFMFVWLWK